jgi:ferrochelatase
MAYGTPRNLDEVEPYYTDVRGGRRPTAALLDELRARYRAVGGRTPLLDISEAQARRAQEELDAQAPGRYRVYLGMKHWHPFLDVPVRQMAADGVTGAVAVALAPHYSRLSIQGYIDRIEAAQATLASASPGALVRAQPAAPAGVKTAYTFVKSWHDEPLFWEALAAQARQALADKFSPAERERVFMLFSAHSLPARILQWDDPYPRELLATSAGVAGLLGLAPERWGFAYQSAGRTPEPWLGPDILTKIRELATSGERALLICPVGFIAEHLEILYDIDIECRQLADELGIHLERIDMLNDAPALARAIAAVVRTHTPADASA